MSFMTGFSPTQFCQTTTLRKHTVLNSCSLYEYTVLEEKRK
jgi:hypothetical protein